MLKHAIEESTVNNFKLISRNYFVVVFDVPIFKIIKKKTHTHYTLYSI